MQEFIEKICCHTNIDDFRREYWPEKFIELPQMGQHIKSRSGKLLKVVGITHCSNFGEHNHPYIIIELGK